MGKILYLECNSGISGDMTVGALLDLGADRAVLERALDSLGVGGYRLHFGRTVKCGLDAYDFDVLLEEENAFWQGGESGHEHGNGSVEEHIHEQEHGYEHDHSHILSHSHGHSYANGHSHAHFHRNLADVYEIIERLESGNDVKALAKKMFLIVAEAESKAHGISIEEVHFHEVGAIDSIVDIISTAVCLHDLAIREVVISPLTEGCGQIRCQHGVIPVPVPATANIAAAYGLALRLTDQEGEMVTPTGAAIAAAIRTRQGLPDRCRLVKIGIGAGKKNFRQANVLRAMLLETETGDGDEPVLWVLESNIDDCGGEALGFTMEMLLEASALDVWSTPVYMKKNRPAYMLSVLCKEEKIPEMEAIILSHTTTIGIRRHTVSRTILERRTAAVKTRFGQAKVKICQGNKNTYYYPEYESVRAICRKERVDFQTVYWEIRKAAMEEIGVNDSKTGREV